MDGPVVTDFAHDVKACALGQASSSIMARHVVGSTASELRELRETVRKMLKENGSPPQGKWADIAPARAGARLQGPPRLDHADLRRRGRRHRPDRSEGEAAGIGVRASPSAQHDRRHAREGGHPVRREFSINHSRRGVLDHPRFADDDTVVLDRAYFAAAEPAPSAEPPVGTAASAVLVDLPGCGLRVALDGGTDEAILHRLGGFASAIGTDALSCGQHIGDRIGGDEIGQPQFVARQFVQIFPRRHAERRATADRRCRPCRRCIWRDARCRAPRSSDPARCSSRPWRRRRGRPSRSDAPGHARPRARNASCPTAAGTRTSTRNRLPATTLARSPCAVWVRTLMPTVVSAPRLRQRRPSAMESLTEPPLESSTMVAPPSWRPRANSSKSLGLSDVTMPTARTQPLQFGWHATQLKLHRQFAFFEGAAGVRRTAQRRDRARQCDDKGRWRRAAPSREISATSRASIWFLPPSPLRRAVAMAPVQRQMILSSQALSKTVTVLTSVVHNTFAAPPLRSAIFVEVWHKYLHGSVPCLGTAQNYAHDPACRP